MRSGTYMTIGVFDAVDDSKTYDDLKKNILDSVEQYKKLVASVKESFAERCGE